MVRRIPFCVSLPPCSMSSRRGLAMAELASMSERRPVLTTSARGGVAYPRSGRKNACSADRGRDVDCSPPPAQTRTGPIKASGSYLEYLTAKRARPGVKGARLRKPVVGQSFDPFPREAVFLTSTPERA